MSVIDVNYGLLRNMANAIDEYCAVQTREMNQADAAVAAMLANDWKGLDAVSFGDQWEGMMCHDSTAAKFKESLCQYRDALRECANIYQTAQEDIYNLSALLPRF